MTKVEGKHRQDQGVFLSAFEYTYVQVNNHLGSMCQVHAVMSFLFVT